MKKLVFTWAMIAFAVPAVAGTLAPPLGMMARGLVPEAMLAVPQLLPSERTKDGGVMIPVFVRAETPGDAVAETLRHHGFEVGSAAGRIVTARIDARLLEDAADLPGVAMIEPSWPLFPILDISAPLIEADRVWNELGERGAGVVVGAVDTGTAWNHPDFYDPDTDESRIAFLWDQSLRAQGDENEPADFSYGVEYTRDELTAAYATGDPDTLRTWDDYGHGTHILGTAGGNGAATGNGYPAFRYVGIAPDAELVAVRATLIATRVLDGVRYVFDRADELGLPAVVNLSLGTHTGAHDGTNGLDQGIAELAGPGRIVVAGAGNEQHLGFHAETTLAESETGTITFQVGNHSADAIIPDVLAIAAYPRRRENTR
ncbi:MAG: S8 family serine peptidase [Deltaproteobacteria bacterium]|nr:S8 family serine peptidase [Deltaproteobacteria bacterium]